LPRNHSSGRICSHPDLNQVSAGLAGGLRSPDPRSGRAHASELKMCHASSAGPIFSGVAEMVQKTFPRAIVIVAATTALLVAYCRAFFEPPYPCPRPPHHFLGGISDKHSWHMPRCQRGSKTTIL
jgi:hypothetical protein